MLLAQHSARGLGLWSLGLPALWWAALSAQSGGDRFGDRRIVLTHAGSIIPSTGIAGITPVDGIIIKLTRVEGDGDNDASSDAGSAGGWLVCSGHTLAERRVRMGVHSGKRFARWRQLLIH